jgi:hypothetical protein
MAARRGIPPAAAMGKDGGGPLVVRGVVVGIGIGRDEPERGFVLRIGSL